MSWSVTILCLWPPSLTAHASICLLQICFPPPSLHPFSHCPSPSCSFSVHTLSIRLPVSLQLSCLLCVFIARRQVINIIESEMQVWCHRLCPSRSGLWLTQRPRELNKHKGQSLRQKASRPGFVVFSPYAESAARILHVHCLHYNDMSTSSHHLCLRHQTTYVFFSALHLSHVFLRLTRFHAQPDKPPCFLCLRPCLWWSVAITWGEHGEHVCMQMYSTTSSMT